MTKALCKYNKYERNNVTISFHNLQTPIRKKRKELKTIRIKKCLFVWLFVDFFVLQLQPQAPMTLPVPVLQASAVAQPDSRDQQGRNGRKHENTRKLTHTHTNWN